MMKPEQFKHIADEALGGLTAGPALLNRARMRANGRTAVPQQRRLHRGLALALSLVVVVGLAAAVLPRLTRPEVPTVGTLKAGSVQESRMRPAADLPRGSLVLSKDKNPAFNGVWERGSGGNYPLLRVDGRFYRLMSHPSDVSALTGAQVGSVAVFTAEPALDNGMGLLSNVAAQDAPVYEVNGMGKSVMAARVGSQVRLFQRVAFAGNGLVGSESLKDTLPKGAVALQLSDVGTVTDSATVSHLMDILYGQASYQGSQLKSGKQALLVQYGNGVVLQMSVSGDQLSAAGTWSCPEFFEAFGEAVQ